MADLFDNYEEDFVELRASVDSKIKNIPNLDGSRRQSEIQQGESDIQELEQLLKSMNLSARNIGSNQSLLVKIREYENEVSKLKTALRKATMQIKASTDRDALFVGGIRDEHLASSMDQRERLLSATEKLERSNVDLRQTIATAEETVGIGIEVMGNLETQKQTMLGIREKLGRVNENLGRAKRIMRTMARRVVTNKLIMAVIILVLLLAVALIVYIKFFAGTDTADGTPATIPDPQPTA